MRPRGKMVGGGEGSFSHLVQRETWRTFLCRFSQKTKVKEHFSLDRTDALWLIEEEWTN